VYSGIEANFEHEDVVYSATARAETLLGVMQFVVIFKVWHAFSRHGMQ
jgi:hypothetical protein